MSCGFSFQAYYRKHVMLLAGRSQVIERSTRQQSSGCANNNWMYHRSFRITSTLTKSVTTAMENERAGKGVRRKTLVHRHIKPVNLSHTPAIRRGKDLEGIVAEFFQRLMEQERFIVTIFLSDFVSHPVEHWIGASQD